MSVLDQVQALHDAHRDNHMETYDALLAKLDIAEKDEDGDTALHYACTSNNAFLVSSFLAKGADVESRNNAMQRPLHVAARNSTPEVVELLLNAGAKIDVRSMHPGILNLGNDFETPLYIAVRNRNDDIALCLLEHGADPNIINNTISSTALAHACLDDNVPMVKALLAHGAQPHGIPNKQGKRYVFPLESAHSAEVVDLLVKAGADVEEKDPFGNTALHEMATVKKKFPYFSDVEEEKDKEPLSGITFTLGKVRATESLHEQETTEDEQQTSETPRPSGRQRTWKRHLEAIQALLRHGAKADDILQDVKEPEIMELLSSAQVKKPADYAKQLVKLCTHASEPAKVAAVEKFLQNAEKEDVLFVNKKDFNRVALHDLFTSMRRYEKKTAAASLYYPSVKIIVELGVDVNAVEDLWGYSILQSAADASSINNLPPEEVQVWVEIFKLLLEHGADKTINHLSQKAESVLDMVRYEELFDLLVQYGAKPGRNPVALREEFSRLIPSRDSARLIHPQDPKKTIRMLVDKGMKFPSPWQLKKCAYNHNVLLFRAMEPYFEEFGIDITAPIPERDGNTLLYIACNTYSIYRNYVGPLALIKVLVEDYGCDVNQKCEGGNSAFSALLNSITRLGEDVSIAELLDTKQAALYMISKGADLNSKNDDGETAIEHMTQKRFNAQLKKYAKLLAADAKPGKAKDAPQEPPTDISVRLVSGDKYWSIETSGNQYIVRYGKLSNIYSERCSGDVFATIEDCQKEAQKQINSKLKGGYTEAE